MAFQVTLAGVDYRRASVEVREQLSFNREQAVALLPRILNIDGVCEVFLLATCNRTEFYLVHEEGNPVEPLLRMLRELRSSAKALHEECMRFVERDSAAVGHLFRIGAGIDSQILGDTHIVTQIKQAHQWAVEAGTVGPILNRMVAECLRAAKRARRETSIGKGSASIGAAVLRSVRVAFPDPGEVQVLVLGAGEAGRDIAGHLAKVRLGGLYFSSRNSEQSALLAREFKGETVPWEDVNRKAHEVDVLIAATTARLPVLELESVTRFLLARSHRLLVVDAGIPRNADPRIAGLPQIRLLNLDSLAEEREETLASRRRQIPRVEEILGQELVRWNRWLEGRAVCRHSEALEILEEVYA